MRQCDWRKGMKTKGLGKLGFGEVGMGKAGVCKPTSFFVYFVGLVVCLIILIVSFNVAFIDLFFFSFALEPLTYCSADMSYFILIFVLWLM